MVVCFGGGGAYAMGFGIGVADGLRQGGIDIATATTIGTSGGSWAAAAVTAGLSFAEVADGWARHGEDPDRRRIWVQVHDLAAEVFGSRRDPGMYGAAVVLPRMRRVLVPSERFGLANAVAASSSLLPWVRPHRIGVVRYGDGGLRSNTSADLAPVCDLQLVVTPLGVTEQGTPARLAGRTARAEIRRWTQVTGGAAAQILPSREILDLGYRGLDALGNLQVARTIHPLAVRLGIEIADRLRADFPGVVSDYAC